MSARSSQTGQLHHKPLTMQLPNCKLQTPNSNDSAQIRSKTWPDTWLGRGLGLDHRRRNRRPGTHHHLGALAADQWLVRLVLGFVGLSSYGMASQKISRYHVSRLGPLRYRASYYNDRPPYISAG